MISNRIEAAQKAVEAQNFESRKHLLEYDDVMNKQREAVYGLRRQLLEGVEQRELILEDYVGGILSSSLDEFAPENLHPDQWNVKGLDEKLVGQFGLSLTAAGIHPRELSRHELGDEIFEKLKQDYESKERILSLDTMRYHERMVMLSVIDGLWKDHLLAMDHLKEGIGLRGYAQQDPLVAYKRESFDMFEAMMARFQEDTARFLFRMQILGPDGKPITAAPEPSQSDSSRAAGGQRRSAARARGVRLLARSPFQRASRQPPSTRSKRNFTARSSANSKQPRAPAATTVASPRSAAPAKRSVATIPVHAAPAKNIRSATAQKHSKVSAQERFAKRRSAPSLTTRSETRQITPRHRLPTPPRR